MRKIIFLILLIAVIVISIIAFQKNRFEHNIYIAQIVEHPALNKTRNGIIDELAAQNFIDDQNIKIHYESAQGNLTIANQIAHKFVSQESDAIIAIGTNMAQNFLGLKKKKDFNLIYSSVTDPKSAKLISDGQNQITGVSNFLDSEKSLEIFLKIMPNLQNLGTIYNPSEINSIKLVENLEEKSRKFNVNLVAVTANKTGDISAATEAIIDKVDAIFINNDNTALSAFSSIIKVANSANKPVFVSDNDIINLGALASVGPDQYKIGRQTGAIVAKILKNHNADDILPEYPNDFEFFFNKKAMKNIKMNVSDKIIKMADKVIE